MSNTLFDAYKKSLGTDLASLTDEIDKIRGDLDRIPVESTGLTWESYQSLRSRLHDAVDALDQARKVLDA